VGWLAEVLARGERQPEVPVVVPHGLCLEEVGYPADDQLADRALATRRRRTPPAAGS
jgi:tRNA pseudouridine38-40 synthase